MASLYAISTVAFVSKHSDKLQHAAFSNSLFVNVSVFIY